MKSTSQTRPFKKGNRVKCELFGNGRVIGISEFHHHKNCPVMVEFDTHERICHFSTDGDFLPNDPKTKITHL